MALGKENTSGKIDFREQVELASETGSVNPKAWPHYYERLRSPNPWPDDDLKQSVMEYVCHLVRLSTDLTDALGLALKLEKNAFQPLFEDPFWQLKLAAVSLPSDRGTAESEFGVGAHTDTGFLTLLLQDDVGGLQVWRDGDWVDAPPSGPGVFVCNIGEVAEIASGGYFRATPHRVVMPKPLVAQQNRKRLSVPFFYNPTLSATIESIELPKSLVWDRDTNSNHWQRNRNSMLRSYGENAFKSLARSHPSVFAEHHPDLQLLDGGKVGQTGKDIL